MKIILLQDVKSLGRRGDVKNVADGYARNFLLPKKLIRIATETAVKDIQLKKEREMTDKKAWLNKLKELAERLKGLKITIKSKEKKGKLFGSVTAKNISDELKKGNFEIDPDSIIIKEAIKKTGSYKIGITLTEGIAAEINLEVSGE